MMYGALPIDCGPVDLRPVEMLFWLYTPVQLPHGDLTLPANLAQFSPIVRAALWVEGETADRYVYLTAKTQWVEGSYIANRPGWHTDGFGTDDVNYIWYDRAPTEFYEDVFDLPPDCDTAMEIMAQRAAAQEIVTYPVRHLLRLDPFVIHRSPVSFAPGMRTFVKVSISKDRYNLEGNSINHGIAERWPLLPREEVRNHPVRADYVTTA